MACSDRSAGAMGYGEIAVGDLHFRVGLATELTDGFDDFRHAATVGRVIVTETTAIRVKRQLADSGNEVAVSNELAAFALFAEAQVFQL